MSEADPLDRSDDESTQQEKALEARPGARPAGLD